MDNVTEEEAAAYIRTKCGVQSRSEIVPESEAANTLRNILTLYVAWADGPKYGIEN